MQGSAERNTDREWVNVAKERGREGRRALMGRTHIQRLFRREEGNGVTRQQEHTSEEEDRDGEWVKKANT